MGSVKSKLTASIIILVIAIVILVSATLAWFTLSANPEITGMKVTLTADKALLLAEEESGEYCEQLDISEHFMYYTELRPVSTADGLNWFIPTYENTGELKNADEFILDDTLSYANSMAYESKSPDAMLLEPLLLANAREVGYYVYTDIWLKTQQPHCKVRLSVPNRSPAELDSRERQLGVYGSYVLARKPVSPFIEDTQTEHFLRIAESAVRVGFLSEGDEFTIYEPNAGLRSNPNLKPTAQSEEITSYVLGYQKQSDNSNYIDNHYIPTFPIELDPDTQKGRVSSVIDPSRLLIQTQSRWFDRLGAAEEMTSRDVETLGRFVYRPQALLSAALESPGRSAEITVGGLAAASENVIVTLEKDIPQRVRIFVWIEGQDADCWNDISNAEFIVNLELAGEVF